MPTSARSLVADPTDPRPPQPLPFGVPVPGPYGTAPPELGGPRPARTPVPPPPGSPRMLRLELGLVLLLAFSPGILGLLLIALGPQGSAEVVAQLVPFFGQREVDFLPEALPLWFRAVQALAIAVTAGVTEEIVVRGYAQTRLEQLGVPTAVILVLPTALWGVLHVYQGVGAALTIFGLGLMYAWYFQRTRRLWPLILAHILFDLTQLVLILAGG